MADIVLTVTIGDANVTSCVNGLKKIYPQLDGLSNAEIKTWLEDVYIKGKLKHDIYRGLVEIAKSTEEASLGDEADIF